MFYYSISKKFYIEYGGGRTTVGCWCIDCKRNVHYTVLCPLQDATNPNEAVPTSEGGANAGDGWEDEDWGSLEETMDHVPQVIRCHGLSVYPVCVCNTVRLGQDTTWNRREHRLSVSPNWVCTMLGGYKRWTFSDGFGDKPSHSIRCVYRADLILCR